ncbi:MAG: class I SAM-dependent methyltransferase [Thermoleophilales bacterium]|nr:class I SAM-dependent methyltransferase [Thermoleophilales bacterium]
MSNESQYLARTHYLDEEVAASYEQKRYSGRLGKYRYEREQAGVGAVIAQLPNDLHFLDVPCGIGRWWPMLEAHASRIDGLDISPAMLAEAEKRVASSSVPVSVNVGDAESLELPDDSVDAVFSHALMKHLPIPLQAQVLGEFSRVSRSWVVCAFSVVETFSYQLWRRRSFEDSYPLLPEQLSDLADSAGLDIVDRKRCTTPLGIEYSVLFRTAS